MSRWFETVKLPSLRAFQGCDEDAEARLHLLIFLMKASGSCEGCLSGVLFGVRECRDSSISVDCVRGNILSCEIADAKYVTDFSDTRDPPMIMANQEC